MGRQRYVRLNWGWYLVGGVTSITTCTANIRHNLLNLQVTCCMYMEDEYMQDVIYSNTQSAHK